MRPAERVPLQNAFKHSHALAYAQPSREWIGTAQRSAVHLKGGNSSIDRMRSEVSTEDVYSGGADCGQGNGRPGELFDMPRVGDMEADVKALQNEGLPVRERLAHRLLLAEKRILQGTLDNVRRCVLASLLRASLSTGVCVLMPRVSVGYGFVHACRYFLR